MRYFFEVASATPSGRCFSIKYISHVGLCEKQGSQARCFYFMETHIFWVNVLKVTRRGIRSTIGLEYKPLGGCSMLGYVSQLLCLGLSLQEIIDGISTSTRNRILCWGLFMLHGVMAALSEIYMVDRRGSGGWSQIINSRTDIDNFNEILLLIFSPFPFETLRFVLS